MAIDNLKVKFWRGTRALYNELGSSGKLEYCTRYTVTEPDGRRNEYFGSMPIVQSTGQLFPVLSIVDTLPRTLNVGDRYLVGHDATFSGDTVVAPAEYYVVEIAADFSQSTISPLGDLSVRVKDLGLKEYQVVDGVLLTYDRGNIIDCGTF